MCGSLVAWLLAASVVLVVEVRLKAYSSLLMTSGFLVGFTCCGGSLLSLLVL